MNVANLTVKQNGFTLIELVVAIVISVVVVGFMAIFLTTPVENYLAQSRRAELIVEADLVARNLDRDIRNAVPNSIREVITGSVVTLEFLAATDMASYRPLELATPQPFDDLDTTAADAEFSTLGKFNRVGAKPFNLTGYYLVIDQDFTQPNHNAYANDKVITQASAGSAITNIAVGTDHVHLGTPFQFKSDSPNDHVFVVSSPVSYICDQSAHTLYRYEGYAISPGIAANHNSANKIGLITNDADICTITFNNANATQGQLVTALIQLKRAGEFMPLFMQIPVENLP